MDDFLDYKNVQALNYKFQENTRENILTIFELHTDFKEFIKNLDFHKIVFSPDIICLYHESLINKKNNLNTDDIIWTSKLDNSIIIEALNPEKYLADKYIATNPVMHGENMGFVLANSMKTDKSTNQLNQAIDLLKAYPAACVNHHLLSSIAIFDGSGMIPDSLSTIFAQRKIFIRHVEEEKPLFYHIDMLIHEISHQYCNLILNLYCIISDYNQTFFSVAHKKHRPIYGIFQTIFVLYRLITVYPIVADILHKHGEKDSNTNYRELLYTRFFKLPCNFSLRLKIYLMKFEICYQQLITSNATTDLGKETLRSMRALVKQIRE